MKKLFTCTIVLLAVLLLLTTGTLAFDTLDPPKPGVKETVDECHHAGIDVAMITGDHKITAFAIAKELDIATDISQSISGAEIDSYIISHFKFSSS